MALDVPKVGGMVIYGARLKGANMAFYGAWLEESDVFMGWMGTRPNMAGGEHDAVHAIGEVLGRGIFEAGDANRGNENDPIMAFRRALDVAADDMGVT